MTRPLSTGAPHCSEPHLLARDDVLFHRELGRRRDVEAALGDDLLERLERAAREDERLQSADSGSVTTDASSSHSPSSYSKPRGAATGLRPVRCLSTTWYDAWLRVDEVEAVAEQRHLLEGEWCERALPSRRCGGWPSCCIALRWPTTISAAFIPTSNCW